MVAVLLIALRCPLRATELTVSEVQTREWAQKVPGPQGPRIFNSDKFVDYKRGGKLVYRVITRKATAGFPPDFKKEPRLDLETHHLEFVADGKVFATVTFDETRVGSWFVSSGGPVQFLNMGATNGRGRVFQVCYPQGDYFEYLELDGIAVKPSPQSGDSYTQTKRAMIESATRGHVHPLEKEDMLEEEKK